MKEDSNVPNESVEAPTNIIQKKSVDYLEMATRNAGKSEIAKSVNRASVSYDYKNAY